MVLTYMEVHLYYTLPVLGVLFYLLKPYHTPDDSLKYKFLSIVAFVTASLWDNYIVYHRAWSYCPTCVTAVIGYVPLEEYMFFLIMTLKTIAFTNLIMRWQLPTFFIKPNTPFIQTLFVRFAPIVGLLAVSYKAWRSTVPDTPLFYGSCILWYACPVLALLWFGAGEYMLRRPISVLLSILIPSIYLCWVDIVAIGAGTWHISLRTSTGRMIAPNLPVEEFMFFTLINTVLVFGTCAIDRTLAVLYLYRRNIGNQSFISRVKEMVVLFFIPDQMVNNQVIDDLLTSWDILRVASKSFYTASAVFPAPIRQDLGVLYGFCRATDDLFDNEEVPLEKRKEQLSLVKSFVNQAFRQKPQDIKWQVYSAELPSSCISAFRSFTRLVHVVEMGAVLELLDGYRWDLERRTVVTEEDLENYSACVASSVGEMCTRVILSYSDKVYNQDEVEWIIKRAREMGLVLQYTNIARDIVTDSQELGRCYLPSEWLTTKEIDMIAAGKARDISHDRLIELSTKLVGIANKLMIQANDGILKLPYHCQGGVRAACNVYASIGQKLKSSKTVYPTRAHVKGIKRAKIALSSVYNF